MPNISTDTNKNDLYKYEAEIVIDLEGKVITLDKMYIKGIVIDYNYDELNYPLIYVYVALHTDIQGILARHKNDGTVIFRLKKYIMNGDSPDLKINVIEDKFAYVIPNSIADDTEEDTAKDPVETNLEDIADTYVIGLAKVSHVNTSRKAINNIFKKSTLSSAIYNILNNHKIVMEPVNNRSIPFTVLPPKPTVATALEELNKKYNFYNTHYRFFMDFDYTYLLSTSAKIIKAKGEVYSDIMINIREAYDEANMEGMITDPKARAYVINVSQGFCQLNENDNANKLYTQYDGIVTASGKAGSATIGKATGELKNKRSYIRIPNGNTGYLNNLKANYNMRTLTLAVSTTKIDSSIFTINKRYTINTDTTYGPEYTGQYLLLGRRDVYSPEGDGMNLVSTINFARIAG